MSDPINDDVARMRFFIISLTRMMGAVIIVIAMLNIADRLDWFDNVVGYIVLALGLSAMFVAPQYLIRKWRTPPANDKP